MKAIMVSCCFIGKLVPLVSARLGNIKNKMTPQLNQHKNTTVFVKNDLLHDLELIYNLIN